MKALFISTHFPTNRKQGTTGTFKRMRTFLDALREKVSMRLLFYCPPDLDLVGGRIAETEAVLRSEWELDDIEIVVCPQDTDPAYGKRLWDGYLVRALSMHRQVGYVCTSGRAQLRAFEGCLEDKPDFIFAHRLPAMCPLLMTKRPLPPVFLDLDDIEHKAFLRNISQPPKWVTKQLYYLQLPALLWGERRAIKLTQRTFVCSDSDKKYLTGTWGLSNVEVVPNSIQIPAAQSLLREPVLLFLGTYAYRPNALAAEELITRIWPIVRDACPTAKLLIAGAKPELIGSFCQSHVGVEYTGFVDDLDELYKGARAVCCPIRSGGGTRIKVIEAAAYGKPIVSTRVGAEGLDFSDGREILLRDGVEGFADACIHLLSNDELCTQLGRAARAKTMERYDRQNVIRLIQTGVVGSLNAVTES